MEIIKMKKKYESAEITFVEPTEIGDILTGSNELPIRPFGFGDSETDL